LTSVIDDFIDIAEARMNRDLRVSQMEKRATATITSEYTALPSDIIAIRNIQLNTSPVQALEFATPEHMDLVNVGETGNPRLYSIVGDELQVYPVPSSASVEIAYYGTLDALSDTTTTNWVIIGYPDIYLYACLSEAFKYANGDAEAAKYDALYSNAVQALKSQDKARKYGQALQVRVA
jgi:hypothetical protein